MNAPTPYQEDRPWGGFRQYTLNEPTTVKILSVLPGKACSLQTHAHRAEFWVVIAGSGTITIGDAAREAVVGDEFWIDQGAEHRILGGPRSCKNKEIAFGHFDEGDIVRLHDDFGRA